MTKYYKESGNYSNLSFAYFFLTCIVFLPIFALIYTYLIWYIPFIYINFFITAGLGFVTGLSVSYLAVKLGKIRNPKTALLLGILGGVIALYFSWAVWIDLVINASDSYGNSRIGITVSNTKMDELLQLVIQPGLILELISEINNFGTWGLFGSTVSGVFLTIIWIIESLIVIVISGILPFSDSRKPFCELSNKWFNEIKLPAFNYINNINELIADIEKSNKSCFDNLELISNTKNTSHSIFTLYSSDKGESFLSIENNLAKTNDKGEIDFDSDAFLDYIRVDNELKNKLLYFNNG